MKFAHLIIDHISWLMGTYHIISMIETNAPPFYKLKMINAKSNNSENLQTSRKGHLLEIYFVKC